MSGHVSAFHEQVRTSLALFSKWKALGKKIVDKDIRELSGAIENTPIWVLWEDLNRLGHCFGQLGLLQIADGDVVGGWRQCHLAYLYSSYGSRLQHADLPRLRKIHGQKWTFHVSANKTACNLLHAMALGRHDDADALIHVIQSAKERGWLMPAFLANNPVSEFAIQCYDAWVSGAPNSSANTDVACYRDAFQDWSDALTVSTNIAGLCDFHVENMTEREEFYGTETIPFESTYTLFCVEVFVLRQLLRDHGLAVNEHVHPYLQSVWANPVLVQPVADDLLSLLTPRINADLESRGSHPVA